MLDVSQRCLIQSVQRLHPKSEGPSAATKVAQASHKLDTYNAVQGALARVRDSAAPLGASKSPPPELVDSLRIICVVTDFLKE
jgi:hypothetical protein